MVPYRSTLSPQLSERRQMPAPVP